MKGEEKEHMNEEQREKWNKYFTAYSKKTYKSVSVRFNYRLEKDLIDYLESQPTPMAVTLKNLVKEKVGK